MPMYEYQCQQCGRRTEKRQKFSDAPLTECPYCGGALKKLISAPAVQFKGGGWYADGYGSQKPAASGPSESSSAKSEGSGSASASDSSKSAASASSDSSSNGGASSTASSGTSSAASSSGT